MKNLFKLLTQKSVWLTGIILLLLSSATNPVNAQVIERYQARLGDADHYNTEGVRLWTIPAIIRQDRANFHTYDIIDEEDEWDRLYDNPNARASLERILSNETFTSAERRAIVNGNPLVEVTVYPDYVDVTILGH